MKIAALAFTATLTSVLAASAPAFAQVAAPAVPIPANMAWRQLDPQNVLVVETNKGTIIAELYPQAAPQTVFRIRALTKEGFYNGNEFFRVIEGFMDQTGDPENSGQGGSKLPNINGEFSFRRGADAPIKMVPNRTANSGFIGLLPVTGQSNAMTAMSVDGKAETHGLFCMGVLGMARAQDPNSANSQFFFMRDTTSALDGGYTPFGRVIHGLDVVKSIKSGEPVAPPRDKMVRVRLLADIPAAEQPKIRAMDTNSPTFTAWVDALREKAGAANFDLCDIPVATPNP
jgi:peptidylprolyl isomerase